MLLKVLSERQSSTIHIPWPAPFSTYWLGFQRPSPTILYRRLSLPSELALLSYTGQKDQEIKASLGAAVCQRLMGAGIFIPAINIYTSVNTPYIYIYTIYIYTSINTPAPFSIILNGMTLSYSHFYSDSRNSPVRSSSCYPQDNMSDDGPGCDHLLPYLSVSLDASISWDLQINDYLWILISIISGETPKETCEKCISGFILILFCYYSTKYLLIW